MANGNIGQIERATQNRVVQLFQEKLGYTYLGNWEERSDNSIIETSLLLNFLSGKKLLALKFLMMKN